MVKNKENVENFDNGLTGVSEEFFPIDEIREEFGKLAHDINWHQNRSTIPYDWHKYGGDHFAKLLKLLKIDFDGSLKFKDKRGYWRVMNATKLVKEKELKE
ncbi:MAG: hypothetical protein AABY22_09905 [Nanoarchaeota archaeon]